MSHPTPPSTPHPTSNKGYAHNPHTLQSVFGPENLSVSRSDILNLIEVGTPVSDLATILLGKGLSQSQVDRIIDDIPSYT